MAGTQHISDLLGKQLRRLEDGTRALSASQEAIRLITGESIPRNKIKVARGILTVRTHPTVRSEIILHKKDILNYIQAACGKNCVSKIL